VSIVEHAREGQILLSFPGFGPITAATIIAAIGSILNFPLPLHSNRILVELQLSLSLAAPWTIPV
jgi:transposase